MGSLEEKATLMKRIVIERDESFVIEVHHKGVKLAEVVTAVEHLTYSLTGGTSKFKLHTNILRT